MGKPKAAKPGAEVVLNWQRTAATRC